jgi:uracil DNA glycosylase
LDEPYFLGLGEALKKEATAGSIMYPPPGKLFAAFNKTPFDQVWRHKPYSPRGKLFISL